MSIWGRNDEQDGVDLNRQLRSRRPEARPDFVETVAAGLHSRPTRRARFGVSLAVAGLILIAVASFGGIGYASGSSPRSSADAQYAPVKPPPKPKPTQPTKAGTGGAAAGKPTAKSASGLPFTGLNLWLPVAGGIVLVLVGFGLRWQGRRRPASS